MRILQGKLQFMVEVMHRKQGFEYGASSCSALSLLSEPFVHLAHAIYNYIAMRCLDEGYR